ncbi:MAG: glycosyltransferase family 39 protein [Anaerolineaceae bacterium]
MTDSTQTRRRSSSSRWAILFFWILAAFESAGVILYLAMIPGDAKNALVLGFSAQRLLMMGAVAAAMVIFILAIFKGEPFFPKVLNAPIHTQQKLFVLFVALATAGWQLSFLMDFQLDRYLAYYQRLQPLLVLVTIFLLQTALLLAANRIIQQQEGERGTIRSHLVTAFVVSMAGFLFFWLIVLSTGLGIGAGNNYWNKVGVPLLGIQIIGAVTLGLFYLFLEKQGWIMRLFEKKTWLIDLILMGLIWGGAAFCWATTPVASSRFNTQPLPPNYTSYPFSDALEYVLSADMILQGKDIAYSYVDKPMHLVFLVFIQLLGGHDFTRVILAQTILLAVMPALLYLLGKSLFNRTAGVMSAVLATFYQINSIQATNLIQVSNVKMMLSEPLTAVGMIVLCLLAIRWLKTSRRWWDNLMFIAGAIGIGSLIRLNVASLGLVLLLVAAVQLRWRWKKVFLAAAVSAVFFSLALTPWVIRNTVVADSPVMFIKNKIHGVVWRKRLNPIIQINPTSTPQATQTDDNSPTTLVPEAEAPPIEEQGGWADLFQPVVSNYAHNLISTILMVPPVLQQGDILHVIREPYWDNEWNGSFTRGGIALLIINLGVISLGIAAAWTRHRMAGIIPILALLAYHITNAVSVVSGGRYIVAVDWVIYFYLALGLAEIIFFLLRSFNVPVQSPEITLIEEPPILRFNRKTLLPIIISLLLAGGLPWVVEAAFPEKYPDKSADQLQQNFNKAVDWDKSGISQEDVKAFLTNPDAVLQEGQAYFPRFYQPGQGDTGGSGSPFGIKDYPHFGFILQGQTRSDINFYLEETPGSFANGIDVIVLGCRGNESVDALLVTTLLPRQTFARPDLRELKCPLAGPE